MHCSFMAAFASGDASPINVKQRHAVSQQQKLPGINNESVQFLYTCSNIPCSQREGSCNQNVIISPVSSDVFTRLQ